MNLQAAHRKVTERDGGWAWAVWALAPLSLLWRCWGATRRFLYENDIVGRTRIPSVMVSVGNIEMGGVGKTPVTIWIADRLSRLGIRTAIVARNLSVRKGPPVAVLPGHSSGGIPISDEALMMSARLHPKCRVFAGPNKTKTALRAFHEVSPQVIIIDDGFQHFRVHRDLDVVVLNASHPFGRGGVFPMGSLREPPSVISRADFLWLNRVTSGVSEKLARKLSAQRNWKAPFIASRLVPLTPLEPDGSEGVPCEVIAFAGIGTPASFRDTLDEAGFIVRGFYEFPDHWNYTPEDCDTLLEALRSSTAHRLATTEKDAARLGRKGMRVLNPLVLPVTLSVDEAGEELLGIILDLVEKKGLR